MIIYAAVSSMLNSYWSEGGNSFLTPSTLTVVPVVATCTVVMHHINE